MNISHIDDSAISLWKGNIIFRIYRYFHGVRMKILRNRGEIKVNLPVHTITETVLSILTGKLWELRHNMFGWQWLNIVTSLYDILFSCFLPVQYDVRNWDWTLLCYIKDIMFCLVYHIHDYSKFVRSDLPYKGQNSLYLFSFLGEVWGDNAFKYLACNFQWHLTF